LPSPVLWRTEPEAPKQVREGVNSGRSFALVEIIIIYITLMMWHATSDDATSTHPCSTACTCVRSLRLGSRDLRRATRDGGRALGLAAKMRNPKRK